MHLQESPLMGLSQDQDQDHMITWHRRITWRRSRRGRREEREEGRGEEGEREGSEGEEEEERGGERGANLNLPP